MARLWEGVPASPCSAASDDFTMRSRHSVMHSEGMSKPDDADAVSPLSDGMVNVQKRPLSTDPPVDTAPPAWKRSRSEVMDVDSASASGSGSIEFVEAQVADSQPTSDFVARLNFSAQDERRKQLLLRLRAIDAKKVQLAQRSPASLDDDVIVVETKPSPTSTKPARNSKGRKNRPPPRKKSTRGKRATVPVNHVIDLDAESSTPSFQKPRPTAPLRAKKSPAGKALPAAPTRTSNRVRRPRTPDAEARGSSDLRVATPTCMSKCKRFQFCKKLISSLLRDTRTGPFSSPVIELWPEEAIPRYFDVITTPMDLRTVKKNLESSVYISPSKKGMLPYQFESEKFMDDVRLVFRNAMVYNRAGDMLFNCAQDLLEDFEKTMDEQLPAKPSAEEVAQRLSRKRSTGVKGRKSRAADSAAKDSVVCLSDTPSANHVAPATAKTPKRKDSSSLARKEESESSELIPSTVDEMRERLTYLRDSRTAVLARTPIPKGSGYLTRAALLYDVEISHSQKQRCVGSIERRVPIGKMEALLDMVKAAGGGYVDNDEEFIFEFDKLDNKAWRNVEAFLEQFVPGFKTIRHSTFGREFNSVDEVEEEIATLQESLKAAIADEPKRKAKPSVEKPRSFFGDDGADEDSSSDESDDDSDSSDDSDSDSDAD